MTREEAARIIKLERDGLKESEKNELLKLKVDPCLYTAFDVAIKALEQEPYKIVINGDARANNANDAWQQGYAQCVKNTARQTARIRNNTGEI